MDWTDASVESPAVIHIKYLSPQSSILIKTKHFHSDRRSMRETGKKERKKERKKKKKKKTAAAAR